MSAALVELRIGESFVAYVPEGQKVIDICDYHDTGVIFSCRAGSCGTCIVEVLQGREHISPRTEAEDIILEGIEATWPRLACQMTVYGPVHLRPYMP